MSPPTYNIEQICAIDYDELIELWEASVRDSHDFLEEKDILALKPLIRNEYFSCVELFCLRKDEKILGFTGLSADKIEMLFVRSDAQGLGVGKRLLLFAIEEKDIRKVDVNEQNPKARAFYEHFGFKTVSRTETDPQGNPFPILCMELS